MKELTLHTKCLSSLFSFFKSLLSRFVERAVHAPWSNWAIEKNFWIGNTICHFGWATVTHCCFTFQKALLFNIAMTNSFLGQSMFVIIHQCCKLCSSRKGNFGLKIALLGKFCLSILCCHRFIKKLPVCYLIWPNFI